jgi:hypothetical protein
MFIKLHRLDENDVEEEYLVNVDQIRLIRSDKEGKERYVYFEGSDFMRMRETIDEFLFLALVAPPVVVAVSPDADLSPSELAKKNFKRL